MGLLGLCLADLGLLGLGLLGSGLLGSVVELARRRTEMKHRISNGNNSASSGCDNALRRGPQLHLIYRLATKTQFLSFENR